jgi:hypothetical protein
MHGHMNLKILFFFRIAVLPSKTAIPEKPEGFYSNVTERDVRNWPPGIPLFVRGIYRYPLPVAEYYWHTDRIICRVSSQ